MNQPCHVREPFWATVKFYHLCVYTFNSSGKKTFVKVLSKFFSVWVLLGIDSPVSWNQSINYMSELGLGSYLLPSASWQAPLSNMVTSSGNLKSSAMNHLKICSELEAASAPRFLKFGMEYLEEGYLSRSINNLNFFLACHSVALCMPLLVIRWT